MNEYLVELMNLRVSFGRGDSRTEVLKGVDIAVKRGEILGIIGESGSGKTMTGLALLRLLPQTATAIAEKMSFEGNDLQSMPDSQFDTLRGVSMAMVFQDPVGSFNPCKTIGWHFEHVLRRTGIKHGFQAEAVRLLNDVGVKRAQETVTLYPHQLSGGMLQRALIALVAALKPHLIVADEPTTNLDKIVEKQVLDLFLEMQRKLDASVIFVTHDMPIAASFCHRVAVMNKGELVEAGPTEQVFRKPQHPYTRRLIDTALELAGANGRPKASPAQRMLLEKQAGETPLFKVRGLSVSFPQSGGHSLFKAIDRVSFDVRPGEILGLLGESGSGKTTLGRTLLRLYTPMEGSIEYQGRDITNMAESRLRGFRREMQMIFQDPGGSFNPRKTMGASLREALVAAGISKPDISDRIVMLLERVGLQALHADRYAHEMSGGQLQRVAIARAIALNPKVIIADEAVSKLDVSVRAGVLNLLADVQTELGMSMIFITHDLDVARYICDRIAVMYHGRLLEIGPTEDVFTNPATEYTRSLLAAHHDLSQLIGA
ncbi:MULTISPECIES: dipeptide ABC transporter ATP-binding protein [Brucella]|uniref:ABC transporter ATP-binding protein n=1 Tax=Brucella pecoris TaxID=867683 RepID=A0A5C5CBZ0_9HYPH|nr:MULTISPECIES: ABC transporter ATP-binding protein [Brucella]MBB4096231.1 peptide/nickel transport system ATP-binding protein [Brucella pecoris]MDG9793354.1 ABC transporter ATP-binding protein [Brucella anthropi]MDH0583140.1 ABC transporter ATP-binding protein [Brucella anthropi]MDH0819754.1 ABC transporter ATP-binding protein [Brucella anthropi]MDH2086400.1 ABC transporter ATP-binding protein [Brucella anthropi]